MSFTVAVGGRKKTAHVLIITLYMERNIAWAWHRMAWTTFDFLTCISMAQSGADRRRGDPIDHGPWVLKLCVCEHGKWRLFLSMKNLINRAIAHSYTLVSLFLLTSRLSTMAMTPNYPTMCH